MRKIQYLNLLLLIFITVSCNNEPLADDFPDENQVNCSQAAQAVLTSAQAFTSATSENYSELCTNYKNALQAQIAVCGDATGTLQQLVDSLGDCSAASGTVVEGTWKLTAWNVVEAIDLNNDGNASLNLLDEMDCYNNETLVFNADNTGTSMSTSYADFEIFIEAGTTNSFDYTINCVEENDNTDFTWSQSGNTVSVTISSSTNDWTLIGNTLSITIPEGFSVTNPDDTTVSTIQDLTLVYTKQ